MAISYIPLEEKNLSAFGVTAPTFNGTPTLFASSSFIFALSITIVIVAASFRYAYAGVLRLPASEEGIRKSKEEFRRVTYGLLGVLGLWLVLFTVNKDMLTGEVTLSALKSSGGGGGAGALTQTVPTTVPITNPLVTTPSGTYADALASHRAIASRLNAVGIHTNHSDQPCSEAQLNKSLTSPPSCTSLAYLPEETIQMLISLKNACGCSVTVSGGTEPGHKSHGENRRPVDLQLEGSRNDPNNSSPLYVFLKKNTNVGTNSNCYAQYVWSSFTFCDEKPPAAQHWHVF